MAERGAWIVPTFNGDYRFDKPILIYWLMRATYAVAGRDEFGARLPSILSGLALVLLTAWAGRRWLGGSCGAGAAAALATCLQFFIHGRLALADMLMVACVTLAQIALGELLLAGEDRPGRPERGWRWTLWLALGLGFLAKGPIAWAVPLLGLLLLRGALWRRPLPWRRLGVGWGAGVMLILIAAWGVPALIATEGQFFKIGVGKHVVERGLEGFNDRGYSPFFYLGSAPLSLFPWVVALPLAILAVRRRRDARVAWLASWAIAPYLIFSFYSTQLPHYVLPGFPALFLLMAAGWEQPAGFWHRVAGTLAWALVALVTGLAVAIGLKSGPAVVDALRPSLWGACAALGGLALFAAGLLGRRGWRLAAPALVLVIAGAHGMGNGLRAVHLTSRVADHGRELPAETRFVGLGFAEPSLVYYSHRRWKFTADAAAVADLAKTPGPLMVVALAREIDPARFWQAPARQRWSEPDGPGFHPPGADWTKTTLVGFNVGRTRWQELTVWTRTP
jgi:4-amino-4-deoxy-L-arabinose transferase-like glycosyltransferase